MSTTNRLDVGREMCALRHMGRSFITLAIMVALGCSAETDTETYGTSSSSTGPMVNSPDKDAGSDSEAP